MVADEKPRIGTALVFRAKLLVAVLIGLAFGFVWYTLLALALVAAAAEAMHLMS